MYSILGNRACLTRIRFGLVSEPGPVRLRRSQARIARYLMIDTLERGSLVRATAQILLTAGLLLAAGCQQAQLEATQTSLGDLNDRIDGLNEQLSASRSELAELKATDAADREALDAQLNDLSRGLKALPETIETACVRLPSPPAECSEETVQRVLISDDKMRVGELEHIWIEPPGAFVVARIDTGATSSSLHAEQLVRFERDGEDWVRFQMMLGDEQSVTLEKQIIRNARVIQQADPKGSRRPVVEMRVVLGDVQDTFEFTLADRSHLENEMILGRNFLADVTLVDVGKQFIQPRHTPQ